MGVNRTGMEESHVECACYGCTIKRQRAGIRPVDRSGEPCNPPEACAAHDQCWTHSEWVDEAACDPPNACVNQLACGAHGKAPT